MSNITQDTLSRAECTALRGLAIIGIFLHNYCHWLGPVVKENEYQYFQRNVNWFSQVLASPDLLFPAHLLSFFGHYGVPIFLFLSAYGLERKYSPAGPTLQSPPRVLPFVRYHYLKLFKMMIVGWVAFTIVDALTPGSWNYTVTQILAQLAMVNNLLPMPDRNIWPGPFWFFGLMLQLYIVYRLLLYRRHWGWTAGLMAACIAVQLFLDPEGEPLNRYRYNFMGGMLPFGLGLLYARYGERIIMLRLNSLGLAMSFVFTSFLVWTMSTGFIAWTFVPAMVCYQCIYLVRWLTRMSQYSVASAVLYVLNWAGKISAALFVIHPVLRKVFIPISRRGDIYTGLLLYVIASLAVAWLINEVMKKIPNPRLNP